jgi:hypothetical protein
MADLAPQPGERLFRALTATRGHARGERRRIQRARTRRADAVEPDAFVLEQAVENTPM